MHKSQNCWKDNSKRFFFLSVIHILTEHLKANIDSDIKVAKF